MALEVRTHLAGALAYTQYFAAQIRHVDQFFDLAQPVGPLSVLSAGQRPFPGLAVLAATVLIEKVAEEFWSDRGTIAAGATRLIASAAALSHAFLCLGRPRITLIAGLPASEALFPLLLSGLATLASLPLLLSLTGLLALLLLLLRELILLLALPGLLALLTLTLPLSLLTLLLPFLLSLTGLLPLLLLR